ncbi:hypothetical protein SOVF_019130, partial [Spinacia oleracea]
MCFLKIGRYKFPAVEVIDFLQPTPNYLLDFPNRQSLENDKYGERQDIRGRVSRCRLTTIVQTVQNVGGRLGYGIVAGARSLLFSTPFLHHTGYFSADFDFLSPPFAVLLTCVSRTRMGDMETLLNQPQQQQQLQQQGISSNDHVMFLAVVEAVLVLVAVYSASPGAAARVMGVGCTPDLVCSVGSGLGCVQL